QGLGVYDLFDGVYGARYDLGEKNRMKKADIIRNLLDEKGIRKEEAILIGDTMFDVAGAKVCDLDVAIVRYGFGQESDFDGQDIAFFADAPADIVRGLEGL
ncbi:MAG: HAD hydrolase-like protein, partial [Clostridia bacterium]|nr:HAD hydrolase-like protein [Clostridia bacterium]